VVLEIFLRQPRLLLPLLPASQQEDTPRPSGGEVTPANKIIKKTNTGIKYGDPLISTVSSFGDLYPYYVLDQTTLKRTGALGGSLGMINLDQPITATNFDFKGAKLQNAATLEFPMSLEEYGSTVGKSPIFTETGTKNVVKTENDAFYVVNGAESCEVVESGRVTEGNTTTIISDTLCKKNLVKIPGGIGLGIDGGGKASELTAAFQDIGKKVVTFVNTDPKTGAPQARRAHVFGLRN
jgi:hypothetical protein